jgi:acetylornithine deacetylase/succinyl-diaminopimelate desuccinylase-like protein
MTKTLDLTRQLVSIPSWVGTGCDEIKVADFIFDWLKANTKLEVIKQPVINGRYNIIAKTKGTEPTSLPAQAGIILAGHIDTVQVGANWETDPFSPVVKNDRLYGRGTSDMKGSLAAMLQAVADSKEIPGLMVLIYIDEEYDFAGMKAFIKEYGSNLSPKLVVSLDGYTGKIGTGCRGLIEVSFKLLGKTGHAGRPDNGVNAIVAGTNCVAKLKRQLATKYSDPVLGISTLNLAYIQGGLNLGDNQYGREGNNIADIAEFVLDIRPASPKLDSQVIKTILTKYAASAKLELIDFAVRHDLGAWITPYEDIKTTLDLPGIPETFGGYVDTQMIWASCGKPTCLAIGAATPAVAHAVNEYVEIIDLEITYQNVINILKKYSK